MKIAIVGDSHLTDVSPKERIDPDYFGTILDKIRAIYENNDIIIHLGDLFDKPTLNHSALNRIFSFFLEMRNKRIFSIIGNHDVPHLNSNLLFRTTLGHLDTLGFVRVVDENFKAGGISFDVVKFGSIAHIPLEKKSDFLIGHCFFENEFDPDYSLKMKEVSESGYKNVFLGHDHSPYDIQKIGDTDLYRIGSICRNTAHNYNLKDIKNRIRYIRLDVENGEVRGITLIPVPHLPAKDVFSQELFLSKSSSAGNNMFGFLGNIDILLSRFNSSHTDTQKATVLSIMDEMNVPLEIRSYIRDKYVSLGMELK